jgi:predicted nucleotidyltransferase
MDIRIAREYYYERETRRREDREKLRQQWLLRVKTAVLQCASRCTGIERVYLFGSLLEPGRFRADSDIDVAIDCDSLETECKFWRLLEQELQRDVDVRPRVGSIADAVARNSILVYEQRNGCHKEVGGW